VNDKITFKDLTTKGKEIIWNSEKNEDNSYKVTMIFDHNKEIVLNSVPSQYVKEDGDIEKKELNEEESKKLIDKRIQSLLQQIQQIIFTTNFYGGKIKGHIASGKENEKS